MVDKPGEYEFEFWKDLQEVDTKDVIPDAVCLASVFKE